jgi:hypothetical protein
MIVELLPPCRVLFTSKNPRGQKRHRLSQTIDRTVEAINAGLQSLKAGRGILGKVAVIVDRDLAAGK